MDETVLSYSSSTGDVALLGETIGSNLERTAARHPQREAVVEVASRRRWTYAEFDAAVNELALGLLAAGIDKGDRVGIWAPNCAEWVLTQYATAKIGAILVNVNPAYRTHELGYVVRQSGMRAHRQRCHAQDQRLPGHARRDRIRAHGVHRRAQLGRAGGRRSRG